MSAKRVGAGVILALALAACGSSDPTATSTPRLPTPTPTSASEVNAHNIWLPTPGTTWQWQLEELPADLTLSVDAYDLDLFDTDASEVAELRAAGRHAICYLSAGNWEEWRDDAADFPEHVIGNAYDGWEGERWLDICQVDALAPVMLARLDLCAGKGFSAIEPDNIDGYTNDTGFPLTYDDQLTFNRWLAAAAHQRGLSIGLKNDDEQVADLVADFDWALTEDCFDQGWCDEMTPFIDVGKAVFAAEYTDTGISLEDFCEDARALGFSAILKDRGLGQALEACS
jgi:hypothetical protein